MQIHCDVTNLIDIVSTNIRQACCIEIYLWMSTLWLSKAANGCIMLQVSHVDCVSKAKAEDFVEDDATHN